MNSYSYFSQPDIDRPRSLVLVGPSRLGKTKWARNLGKHNYFQARFNLKKFVNDPSVTYHVWDDIDWDAFKYNYKFWLGSQREGDLTDKYCPVKTIENGVPSIVLLNNKAFEKYEAGWDSDWIEKNVDIVKITCPLF